MRRIADPLFTRSQRNRRAAGAASTRTRARGTDLADHVEAGGIRQWYDERGTGDPVVLLHGGLTDTRNFTGNLRMRRAAAPA
jgi:pimeloyl-ACP methyl ester carboxylesterase